MFGEGLECSLSKDVQNEREVTLPKGPSSPWLEHCFVALWSSFSSHLTRWDADREGLKYFLARCLPSAGLE